MPIPEDLAAITHQEAELLFPTFDFDTAWRLGQSLRELAISRKQSLVIDIRRFGQPHQHSILILVPIVLQRIFVNGEPHKQRRSSV